MPKYRVPSFITKEYELEHVLALPAASRRRHNMYTTCAACHKQIETEFLYAGFAQGQPNRMFHFDCLDELSQAIIEYPKCQKCGEECREGQGECTGNYTHFKCMAECPQCHSKDPDKMILACLPRHPWHNAKLAA